MLPPVAVPQEKGCASRINASHTLPALGGDACGLRGHRAADKNYANGRTDAARNSRDYRSSDSGGAGPTLPRFIRAAIGGTRAGTECLGAGRPHGSVQIPQDPITHFPR